MCIRDSAIVVRKDTFDKYIQSIEDELEELDYNDPKDKRKIASREQVFWHIYLFYGKDAYD